MKYIEEALKMHITIIRSLISGYKFYIKLNPDFLLSLAQVYLPCVDIKEMLEGKQAGNFYVGKGKKSLEAILKQMPGFIAGYLLKAKVK